MKNQVSVEERLRASSNVIDGDDYKKTLLTVSHLAATYLAHTLGPYAHTTILDDGQYRYSTKDGWSIANRLTFNDPLADSLFSYIKNISYTIVSKVGDGTTTAIVAADKFIQTIDQGVKLSNYRQRDVLAALNSIKDKIVDRLESSEFVHYIDPNGDFDEVRRIAYTSTNGNEKLAEMIQSIYQATKNPNIYVDFGSDLETSYEIQRGYRLDCSPKRLQAYSTSDTHEFKTGVGTTIGFFFNHNLTYMMHRGVIDSIIRYTDRLSQIRKRKYTAVVFSPYFEDTLSGQINNVINQDLQAHQAPIIMMCQVPLMTTMQQNYLDDLCTLVGAQIINAPVVEAHTRMATPGDFTEESNKEYKEKFPNLLKVTDPVEFIGGYAVPLDHVTFNQKFMLLEEYDTESAEYKARLHEIESAYKLAMNEAAHKSTFLEKSTMDASMRYIRFFGQMGIIHVGGESELERRCTKDSIDDAVLASRSAFENGFVKGMNLATIGAIEEVEKYEDLSDIEIDVLAALKKSFILTVAEVIHNKYPEYPVEGQKTWVTMDYRKQCVDIEVLIENSIKCNCGYNLVTEEFEDNDHLTVVNSISSDVEILKAIVSILGYVLTSNQMLSITKSYDRDTSRKIRQAEDYAKYNNIGHAIVDAFAHRD